MRLHVSLARATAVLSVALASVLNGCGSGHGVSDTTRAAAVAVAAGETLTGGTLERWLLKNRQAPTVETASVFISAWINSTLLIDAIRRRVPLDDSAIVDAAIVPDAERGLAMQYFLARHAKLPPVTDRQVDSLLDADQVRVFQQIFLRLPPGRDTATLVAFAERAQGVLRRATAASDFTAVVKEVSEDSASRANNGYIPAVPHDAIPEPLGSLWSVGPGNVSPLVRGPNGYFIFRRATRAESRPGLKAWLGPQIALRNDSRFSDSLSRAHPVRLATDAGERLRAIFAEPVIAGQGPPLATWDSGSVTPTMVRTAALTMPPGDRARMMSLSDSGVTRFVGNLARTRMLMGIVAKEPMPTALGRKMLTAPFRQAVDSLRVIVGRIPANLSPGSAAARQIDSSLAGKPSYIPLPGALAAVLRDRSPLQVHREVMERIVHDLQSTWQALHRDDAPSPLAGPRPDSSRR